MKYAFNVSHASSIIIYAYLQFVGDTNTYRTKPERFADPRLKELLGRGITIYDIQIPILGPSVTNIPAGDFVPSHFE